jgi:hypothetical protein
MFKKIIKFIKYNTMITAIIAVAFVAVASVMASSEDVKKMIGEEIVEKSGVDNTVLLAADLEEFDLKMEITNALEDEENFYIDYQYNTLAIKDNVWREVLKREQLMKREQLIVSKASLDGGDLGLYLMEELGEIIDYQLAFLKEVQEKEEEKGMTVVLEKTEYTGLIGLVFDTKTKELPGYEPVVKPPVVENSELSSGYPELSSDESSDETTDDALEGSAYYEFLINNCLDDGGYWYGGTCNAEEEVVVPVCDSDNLDLCDVQEDCETAGGHWYDSDGDDNDDCNTTAKETACVPNWECSEWDPVDASCGAAFTQTRTCTDANECGADQDKPSETQDAVGTDDSECGITSCDGENLVGECNNICGVNGCEDCVPECVENEGN